MGDVLYQAIRFFGAPFRYRVVQLAPVREGCPAVFVANHLGSSGPIQAILSMPLRLYPWVVAEMTDSHAPEYLYDDFVRPAWHLEGMLGAVVSGLVGRIAVGLLNGLGSIPVERSKGLFDGSLAQSLALLRQGKRLLIFPEDPDGDPDPETLMRPFHFGHGWISYLYQRETGRSLPVHPLAICPASRTIVIGEPLFLEVRGRRSDDIRLFCRRVEGAVKELYRQSLP